MWPAVPTVSGTAPIQASASRTAHRSLLGLGVAHRPRVEHDPLAGDPGDDRRSRGAQPRRAAARRRPRRGRRRRPGPRARRRAASRRPGRPRRARRPPPRRSRSRALRARAASSSSSAPIIASAGTAAAPPSRWARSVASSAASCSLSSRIARASGWRRQRSTASRRPTRMPACGPPSSLSPEQQTRSAPAATAALHRRLAARPARALPSRGRRSSRCRARGRAPASSAGVGLLGEADHAEVGLVDAEDRAGALRRSPPRSRRAGCGWSCRPRPAGPPTGRGSRGSGTSRRSRPARRG